ncbi:aminocarboxymuconate-semialdehyde decarboxylase [Paracoccus halophilus]|uniref:Aminocarboxymuconate-semialdehyde decarboxylase n=1 Tax=Paracoccus halophilus TaxID=376733 RepID=A0A1I0TNU0_9RHOB|nr:amidohydrolase family protein [Paracoccus halophilus]SFA52686.1 aminocarboxymuconate-semialdehyde decarboxylase [Paracoccus halophilus]
MSQPIALDIHAHLVPVDADRLPDLPGVGWDGARMEIDGHKLGVAALYRPRALLDWMDREQVAHAWISAPPPTYRQHLRGDEARRWCAYLNDGLAGIAGAHPDRLTALPHLPTQDPALAADIARLWGGPGWRHFSMPAGTGDARALSEPEFTGLWAALDRIGATVFIHPGECADGRLRAFYLHNLLGNPYESAVAISHLILGGVLERHRNITPCFAHGGGAYPMVAARLQRGFDSARPDVDGRATPPDSLLSRIHVDCICHAEAPLHLAEQVFGRGNVHFGSDWPFPMGLLEPGAQLAALDPETRKRILQTNAAALTGVPNREKDE